MTLHTSNKILLISRNKRLSETLRGILKKQGLEISDSFPNLSSIDTITSVIRKTKNTGFIRTELLRFIRETGFPFLFIMDYTIDLEMDSDMDPDRMKLLRTLFISYIILSRGSGFDRLRGNFLFLAGDEELRQAKKIESEPHRILQVLTTSDPIVNSFIDEMKQDTNRFNQLFFIRTLDTESQAREAQVVMDNTVKAIRARENLARPKELKMVIDHGEYEAARVLYRIDDKRIYIDGEIKPVTGDNLERLEKNEFYISGRWVNKTLIMVADKITSAIKKGLAGEKSFKCEEEIIINLTEMCVVDSTLTPSLIQILTYDLNDYPRIIIRINESNNDALSQAKGYNLLKKSLNII